MNILHDWACKYAYWEVSLNTFHMFSNQLGKMSHCTGTNSGPGGHKRNKWVAPNTISLHFRRRSIGHYHKRSLLHQMVYWRCVNILLILFVCHALYWKKPESKAGGVLTVTTKLASLQLKLLTTNHKQHHKATSKYFDFLCNVWPNCLGTIP